MPCCYFAIITILQYDNDCAIFAIYAIIATNSTNSTSIKIISNETVSRDGGAKSKQTRILALATAHHGKHQIVLTSS